MVWTESVRTHWEPLKSARDAGHSATVLLDAGTPGHLGGTIRNSAAPRPTWVWVRIPAVFCRSCRSIPTAVDSTTATDNTANICYQDGHEVTNIARIFL